MQHWAVWEALNKQSVSEDIVGVLKKCMKKLRHMLDWTGMGKFWV